MERKLLLDQMRGITPSEKKQRQIWTYMKFHPKETNYSTIAEGAGVNRHTVAKWYEMIRGMLGIPERTSRFPADCQAGALVV